MTKGKWAEEMWSRNLPPPLKKETKLGISLYNPPKVGLKVVFINSKIINF